MSIFAKTVRTRAQVSTDVGQSEAHWRQQLADALHVTRMPTGVQVRTRRRTLHAAQRVRNTVPCGVSVGLARLRAVMEFV